MNQIGNENTEIFKVMSKLDYQKLLEGDVSKYRHPEWRVPPRGDLEMPFL